MFDVNVRNYNAKLRAEGRKEGLPADWQEGLQEADLIHAREIKELNVKGKV